jgi:hypothetical protein
MTNTNTIDLAQVRTSPESRVFSGRERGLAARQKFNLTRVDLEPGKVTILIPQDTYSMNMSFFLGMFGDSVRSLGREGFNRKYRFESDPVHLQSIVEGINRALKESSVLPERDPSREKKRKQLEPLNANPIATGLGVCRG